MCARRLFSLKVLWILLNKGVPVKCKTKQKRNGTKRNETNRNETDRNETNRNETKRNKSKRNETNDMASHCGQNRYFLILEIHLMILEIHFLILVDWLAGCFED